MTVITQKPATEQDLEEMFGILEDMIELYRETLNTTIGEKDPRVTPSYRELSSFVFFAGPIVRLLAVRNQEPPRPLVHSAAALLQAMRKRIGDQAFTEWVNALVRPAEEDLQRLSE